MKGWIIVGAIEAFALALGVLAWHFGWIAWYVAPLFLLAPPLVAAVAVIAGIASASRRGENPFQ